MKFKVTRRYMPHGGGTKFFQIYLLCSARGDVLTVTHYGKVTRPSSETCPKEGGQTQVLAGNNLDSKTREKEKRGYSTFKDEATECSSATALNDWMHSRFDTALLQEVAAFFRDAVVATDSDIEEAAEPEPMVPKETAVVRPDEWGSW